jgi:hypothetical protein
VVTETPSATAVAGSALSAASTAVTEKLSSLLGVHDDIRYLLACRISRICFHFHLFFVFLCSI